MKNDKKLKRFSEEFFGKSMEFLSLKYVRSKGEEMIFSCNFKEDCSNPMGFVQGGMITTALDDATSAAMISGYEKKKCHDNNLHVCFMGPPIGPAKMKVKIIKLGRSSATSEGDL